MSHVVMVGASPTASVENGLGYKVGPFTQSQEPKSRLIERACALSRGGSRSCLQLVG